MLRKFKNWAERVFAAGGTIPDRIRYTRKSTSGDERQAQSHPQQSDEADKKWGVIDPVWWWKDSMTGTTFDRPAFQDMLEFCRAHKRSKKAPGRVEVYDPSRFGRALDDEGEATIAEFRYVFDQFEKLGWRVEFVTVERTGNVLGDDMLMAIHAYQAATFSVKLSKDVARGKRSQARDGYWTGGRAPWGTLRFDEKTGKILGPGERSIAGKGGTILVPDEDGLSHWNFIAPLVDKGMSLDRAGAVLFDRGVTGPNGGKLGHSSIKNLLINPALVGEVRFIDEVDGVEVECRKPAKWPAMVDVELFRRLEARYEGPAASSSQRRKKRESSPLTPICGGCGGEYHGGRLSATQDRRRQYAHGRPKARMDPDGAKRFDEAGCKIWYVDANELETKIKELIATERSSSDFEAEVRGMILHRDRGQADALARVEECRQQVRTSEARYARHVKFAEKVLDGDDADDALVEQHKALRQQISQAKAELAAAEKFSKSSETAWAEVCQAIHETRNLVEVWDSLGTDGRKTLLDYWVYQVVIVTKRVSAMKRGNGKVAIVWLRSAPGTPLALELGRPTSDGEHTEQHHGEPSSSDARSASSASGVPILATAHRAGSRTRASSDRSERLSSSTSSALPMLPSTTAALRLRPRSLARFIGEPLNATENSDGDIASNSRDRARASFPVSTGRAANASSLSGFENLWLNGQTSWHTSQP